MDMPRVGVSCIIVNAEGRVLFGKRKKGNGIGNWAPPGGHLEFDEEPSDASAREALEETGIKVRGLKFVGMTNDIFTENRQHYITLHYACRIRSAHAKVMEPEKCERWEWFEWDKCPGSVFLPIRNLKKQGFKPLEVK